MRYEIPNRNSIFEKLTTDTAKTVSIYACGAAAAVIAAFYVGNKIAGYFGSMSGVNDVKEAVKPHTDDGENSDNNSNNGK